MAFINQPISGGSYYFTVYALTPKQNTSTQPAAQGQLPAQPSWLPPLYIYAPFLLFFALFLGAFGIQIIGRARSLKHTLLSLIIALFAASLPLVLTQVREGVNFRSRAAPDQVPQNVQVAQSSRNSLYVTWTTEAESVGAVRLGPAPLSEKTSTIAIGDLGNQVTNHSVKLENLKPDTGYEMEILSGAVWFTDKGKPIQLRLRGM